MTFLPWNRWFSPEGTPTAAEGLCAVSSLRSHFIKPRKGLYKFQIFTGLRPKKTDGLFVHEIPLLLKSVLWAFLVNMHLSSLTDMLAYRLSTHLLWSGSGEPRLVKGQPGGGEEGEFCWAEDCILILLLTWWDTSGN